MSVAEWERDIIGERMREALAEAKEQGVRIGRPTVIPEDSVAKISRLPASGLTLRAVADTLTTDGVPTAMAVPAGTRPWSEACCHGPVVTSALV